MAIQLRDDLEGGGFPALLTREPGGTAIGEGIRSLLLAHDGGAVPTETADAFLFNAARAQLVAEVIRPALERGETVICARFADSTIAYQGYGAGLPVAELRALEAFATGGLRPDLTILLDLPAEVGLARKAGDEINRFEAVLDLDFHRRVRDGFLALAAAEPERFAKVDATVPADTVYEAIVAAVTERFPEFESAFRTRLAGRGGPADGEPAHAAVRSTR
jgi:dTMP kinase